MKTILSKIPTRESFFKGQDTLKIGYPWLTFGAILSLESLINKKMKVLEFGSGGSTVFWAQNAKSVKSYETDAKWFKDVSSKTKGMRNVELVLADRHSTSVGLKSEPKDYYDIVLIDSDPSRIKRLDLANMAISKVKPGGFLILDNYAAYGLNGFVKPKLWREYSFDDFGYTGLGTKFYQRPA